MADYRTPLPSLLAGFLEAAINRVLALDEGSVTRLERLEGKCLKMELQGLNIDLFLTFGFGIVRVMLDMDQEPDTVISGTPVALFAMAAPDEVGDWGLPGSGVSIQGNANLARDLGNLFSKLDANWEGPLASLLGDTLGFQVASGIRQGAEAVREAARSSADMAASYFRDEAGVLVRPSEMAVFTRAVDELADAVARLETRIKRLSAGDSA